MLAYFFIRNWISKKQEVKQKKQARKRLSQLIVQEIAQITKKPKYLKKIQKFKYRKIDQPYFKVKVDRSNSDPYFPLFYNKFSLETDKSKAIRVKKNAQLALERYQKQSCQDEQEKIIHRNVSPHRCQICSKEQTLQDYHQHIRNPFHRRKLSLRTPTNIWITELNKKYQHSSSKIQQIFPNNISFQQSYPRKSKNSEQRQIGHLRVRCKEIEEKNNENEKQEEIHHSQMEQHLHSFQE